MVIMVSDYASNLNCQKQNLFLSKLGYQRRLKSSHSPCFPLATFYNYIYILLWNEIKFVKFRTKVQLVWADAGGLRTRDYDGH